MGKKKSILFDKYAEPTPSPVEKKPTKRIFRDEDESDGSPIYQKKQKKVPQRQTKQLNNNKDSDMEIDSDKENVANQIPSPVTSKSKKTAESRNTQSTSNASKGKSTATEKVQPVESVKPQSQTSSKDKSKAQPIMEITSDGEQDKPKQTRNSKSEKSRLLAEVDKEIKIQQQKKKESLEKEEKGTSISAKTTARASLEANGEVEKSAEVKPKSRKGKKTSDSSEEQEEASRPEPESDDQDRNAKKKRDSSEGVSQKEFEKLKQKYETLRTIRETEPEQLCRQLKANVEEKEQASSKLIAQLKDENSRLQELVQKRTAENKKAENSKQVSQLQIEVSELKVALTQKDEAVAKTTSVVNFYEMLSSIKITPIGEDRFECECFHTKIPKRSIRFELAINKPEIQYTPLKHSKGISLPDFLIEPMCFQEDELPAFLQKTIVAMYKAAPTTA